MKRGTSIDSRRLVRSLPRLLLPRLRVPVLNGRRKAPVSMAKAARSNMLLRISQRRPGPSHEPRGSPRLDKRPLVALESAAGVFPARWTERVARFPTPTSTQHPATTGVVPSAEELSPMRLEPSAAIATAKSIATVRSRAPSARDLFVNGVTRPMPVGSWAEREYTDSILHLT